MGLHKHFSQRRLYSRRRRFTVRTADLSAWMGRQRAPQADNGD